jgi:alpha 1,3-glucosidase
VGGFFGNPDGELLTRWLQVGAFQPFYRGHAHLDSKRREPWVFPEPYLSAMRTAIRSRYVLQPYLYTLFHEASQTGVPVVRPLWMEFPAEEALFAEEESFMLGEALLVAPVTQAGATSVAVRFPAGSRWFRFDGALSLGAPEAGEGALQPAPLDGWAPAWLRGGSVVPRMERVRRATRQQQHDPLTLVVGLDGEGRAEGRFFWDDGASAPGGRVLRQLRFAGGRLSNTDAAAPGAASGFECRNVVERIVVAGLIQAPTAVTAAGRNCDFEWTNGVLTVRRPQLPIAENWELQLK